MLEATQILDASLLPAMVIAGAVGVLLGAIAAARAARTYDTVMLRVLGASRRQILLLQLAEYGLLAGVLALVALAFALQLRRAQVVCVLQLFASLCLVRRTPLWLKAVLPPAWVT